MLFLFFAMKIPSYERKSKPMTNRPEIKAVFFDLDGTLLPMDQTVFAREYFKGIAGHMAPHGVDPKDMIDFTLKGTDAMVHNDGSRTNEQAFWGSFFDSLGEHRSELEDIAAGFYTSAFKDLKDQTSSNPHARAAVIAAGEGGKKVVLATNPIFPMTAQLERMSWIGLCEDDFDLITSYENSGYCKPNPDYYREICDKIGVPPQNCLMIGNDEREDMKAASEAGLSCFLVTDCRIMSDHFVWTGERGSFEQALHMIERL